MRSDSMYNSVSVYYNILSLIIILICASQLLTMYLLNIVIRGNKAKNSSISHWLMFYEMSYLNSTLNFGIPTVLVFQLEVYYKVDRLLTAQQKGTAA